MAINGGGGESDVVDSRGVHCGARRCCPVCQSPAVVKPRPLIPAFLDTSTNYSATNGESALNNHEGYSNRHSSTDVIIQPQSQSLLQSTNADEDGLEHIAAMVGMLRQVRGVIPSVVNAAAGEETGNIAGRLDCLREERVVDEHYGETELPGTCLPPPGAKVGNAKTPQQTCDGVEIDEAETPTIHESQISSEHLSSMKEFQSLSSMKGNANNKHPDATGEYVRIETEVPRTCLPPLHSSATNCNRDKRVDVVETPTVRESQISLVMLSSAEGLFLPSSIKRNANNIHLNTESLEATEMKDTHHNHADDANSPDETPINEHGTEVPGTNLSPLRKNLDEREYLSNGGQQGMFESQINQSPTQHNTGTEIPGTHLPALSKRNWTVSATQRVWSHEAAKRIDPIFKHESQVDQAPTQRHNETEVSGTELPPLTNNYNGTEVPGTEIPQSVNNSAAMKSPDGPRRVSTSPAKAPIKQELQPEFYCSPNKRQKLEDKQPTPYSQRKELKRGIMPWNISSDPLMSQLTCDVKTCQTPRMNAPGDGSLTSTRMENPRTNTNTASIPQERKRKLCVAYDALDQLSERAMKAAHEQGLCVVVNGGIQTTLDGRGKVMPFPAILITHASELPDTTEKNKGSTCYRTYSYLKARALGAHVVDSRWMLDSQNAGILFDFDSYKIGFDLESHHRNLVDNSVECTGDSRPLGMKFEGVTFGMLRGLEPLVGDQSISLPTSTSIRLETKSMTTPEIESLVKCWGGRITEDSLTHMDYLLVDDWMTLDQITKGLRTNLKSKSNISRFSIETYKAKELDEFIVDGGLRTDFGYGNFHSEVRIPILRIKWVEDSICLNQIQRLGAYCWGICCL